jgi:hypothetical protein
MVTARFVILNITVVRVTAIVEIVVIFGLLGLL